MRVAVQYNARWHCDRIYLKEASIVSEELICAESPEAWVEEPAAQNVEAPRSNGASEEKPTAEVASSEQEAEAESSTPESDNVQGPSDQEPASPPEAAESAPTAEATVAEEPSESTEEPAKETEPRKRRRRRRRRRRSRSPVAITTPVEVKVIPPKKIIKPLKRGMELEGTVRRIADFGAFIDIGVGTDGLVHISEISPTRIGKVSDVLQEGQQVKVWIKDLDRERNRISLTMIPPGTKTIRNLEEGEIVHGTVTRLVPYGAFVDIGIGREALLHVREMAERYVARPEDVVKVGEELEVRVISVDRRRQRVDLSLKGLRPEPEEPEPETFSEDGGEDEEIPSIIAVALQKALQAEAKAQRRRERRERRHHDDYDEEIEEIISRTLRYRGNN